MNQTKALELCNISHSLLTKYREQLVEHGAEWEAAKPGMTKHYIDIPVQALVKTGLLERKRWERHPDSLGRGGAKGTEATPQPTAAPQELPQVAPIGHNFPTPQAVTEASSVTDFDTILRNEITITRNKLAALELLAEAYEVTA